MVADEFRRAIEAAPRMDLDKIATLMWRACANDRITEAEVTDLSNLIDLRRIVPEAARPPHQPQGSRPRTPESMSRRRRLAASGRLPPALASHFTLAEMAVMAVLAIEVVRKGQCTLCIERIAACAGVCRTTVKNAMRHAKELKLITVEERRQTFWRNLTNVVRVVSPEWQAWNRLASLPYHLRGGDKVPTGTSNLNKEEAENGQGSAARGCRKKGGDRDRGSLRGRLPRNRPQRGADGPRDPAKSFRDGIRTSATETGVDEAVGRRAGSSLRDEKPAAAGAGRVRQ